MEFAIEVDPARGFVRCSIEGEVDLYPLRDAWRRASALAFPTGGGVVLDATRARNRCSYPSLYSFVRNRRENYEHVAHSMTPIAVLTLSGTDIVRWQFFVFAAENYGLRMQLFHDEQAAAQWLAVPAA
jgi:hypothetical protein